MTNDCRLLLEEDNLNNDLINEMEYKINDVKYDSFCNKKCNLVFHWKRFFLPLAISLPILIYFDKLRNDIYIFISCMISSLIICWNFPKLAKLGHMRPIYIEDLDELDNLNKKVIKKKILNTIESSKKFQYRFVLVQQLILSITLALIIEYATYRYKNTQLFLTEILGLLGGLVSLYSKITRMLGKLILYILYQNKKKEREKMIQEITDKLEYRYSFRELLSNNGVSKSASDSYLHKRNLRLNKF